MRKLSSALTCLFCLMSVLSFSVKAEDTVKAEATLVASEVDSTPPLSRAENITTTYIHYPFEKLEWVDPSGSLALSGITPRRSVRFTVKRNEIVTKSYMELFYTPSPSLIPVRSQLNVYLNGIMQKTIPIHKEDLGKKVSTKVALDTHIIRDENLIEFEFIGHYTDYCENPVDTTLWLNISAQTTLHLGKQLLHLANDLSSFPLPFINTSTGDKTVLSLIFPQEPDLETIKAASIFSSYGGTISSWRGVDYPVFLDKLPSEGNAVVFMTNSNRPVFLKDYPKTDTPVIEMADIPGTQSDKMLIINAPDSQGLVVACRALAQGNVLFNGPLSRILEFKEIEKRKPYDAPNWADTSKKITFGSLTNFEGQLSSQGFAPAPIELELNLPPDLYFVNGSRIAMDLIYKYTKPSKLGLSQMRLIINEKLIRSYPLNPDEETDEISEYIPLLGNLNIFNRTNVDTSFLRAQNQFRFDFKYSLMFTSKMNECNTIVPIPNRVEIDPNSSFDFTNIYHFTKMPNLNTFWQSGYPFSIYADLQRTAIVLSELNETSELNTLFNTLARIGSQLGYPALNLEIIDARHEEAIKAAGDKDFLVIGRIPDVLSNNENAAIVLNKTEQSIKTSFNDSMPNRFTEEKAVAVQNIKQSNYTGIGAIVSYRSPLSDERTLVAIISDSSEGMSNISQNIIVNHSSIIAAGSVTVIDHNRAKNYDVGDSYYIGDLPWYQRMYYMLLESPFLLMFLCLFSALIFCVLMYRTLRRIQRARLRLQALRKEQ